MPNRYSTETVAQQPAFHDIGIFAIFKEGLESRESYIFMFLIMIFLEDTCLGLFVDSIKN